MGTCLRCEKISQSHSSQSKLVHLYCCNWLLLFGHLTKFPISEYNYVINSYETQNNVAYINLYRKLLKIEPNAIHQLVLIIPVDNVALWIIAALFLVLTKAIEVHKPSSHDNTMRWLQLKVHSEIRQHGLSVIWVSMSYIISHTYMAEKRHRSLRRN